jgi:hypothetical protein
VTVHPVAGAARLHHLAASAGSGEAARRWSPDVGEIAMTRLQSIEHFVVLMLENRSFDNLLGGLYPKSKDFDGVDGSESNKDRSGNVWPLTETPGGDVAGLSVPNPDPGEHWQDTPFDHASVINTLRHRFELGDPLTARVEAAPTLERALNLDAPENLGPTTIAASDCKVGLFYKIKFLFEVWNDFQVSLHDMARKLPTADHGRAQVFLDRHVNSPTK